jgi:hypothetical protein
MKQQKEEYSSFAHTQELLKYEYTKVDLLFHPAPDDRLRQKKRNDKKTQCIQCENLLHT